MAAPLVDHSNGDIIDAGHVNDIKDYIEDGVYQVNTLHLEIAGTTVINADRHIAVTQTAVTGHALDVNRNLAAGSTDLAVVHFQNTNATDDQPTLQLTNAGTRGALSFVAVAADPSAPSGGDIWFNSTDSFLRYYNGGSTVSIGSASSLDDAYNGGATITVDTAATPVALTQTSTTGAAFTVARNLAAASTDSPMVTIANSNATDDQPSLQLTNAGTRGALSFVAVTTDPSGPAEGDMWFNTTDNFLKYYDGTVNVSIGSGGGGGLASFLYTNGAASTTWVVTHNLNDSFPQIEVFDAAGDPIEPQSITIDSANALTITFSIAQDGDARIHGGTFAGGTGSGTFLPTVDDSFDLGSATFQWQDLFLSGNATTDSVILNAITAASATNSSLFEDSADNVLKWKNSGGTTQIIHVHDATGRVYLREFFAPSSGAPSNDLVGNTPVLSFDAATNETVYQSLDLPEDLDPTADVTVDVRYSMSTSVAGDVKLDMEVNMVADGEDLTPGAPTESTTDTFTAVATAEQFTVKASTTLKISNANITAGDTIHLKFFRDAVAGGDTHTGDFQLESLALVYTRI